MLRHTTSSRLTSALEELESVSESGDPLTTAFLTRGLQGLLELVRTLDDSHVGDATSAPSDLEALLVALQAASHEELYSQTESALLQARLRGRAQKRELLAANGGTVSSTEMGELLGGITRQAVDLKRQRGELLAVKTANRWAYPLWQVENGQPVEGLSATLSALEDHDPWMQLQFFFRSNPRLEDERPVDLLIEGADAQRLDQIVEAAHAYGSHGGL